jgi:ABC-type Na+ efflux pump permease subunit
MKAAAILSLLVAAALGIMAIRKFAQDDERRHQAINRALEEQAFNRALAVPVRDQEKSALAEVKHYKAEVSKDRMIGLAAVVFLIASLVMFSTASHHADAVLGERAKQT